ncbi:unnamed protein product [Cuscuta epithymum]|uniref:Uncharacterized protein n=1 Tax=Cuscuta epithymum TaxID=186058 RepID=A0AAV0END5_9ASTE|nr:unnamed protein product [Cuscuta epithymum]
MIGPSAPSYPVHGSARPFPPGWRRPSYAVRPAPQRHRTQLTFSSPIPSRMATTVLCSMIGPSAPSYPVHGSARPFPPGWRRPSYAVRPSLQRHRTQLTFSSSIPSRVATNVLCITIGPSAPSCPDSRFGSPIPFQDGDDRLMQYDRPLSAIVPGFTVQLAHSLRDGDDRLMQHDRPLNAIVSLSRSDRASPPGWRRTSYAVRSAPSAPSYLASRFGSRISSRMATNVLCSAIGPSAPSYLASRFGSHIPSGMATTVLCSAIGPSAPSCLFHVRIAHLFQDGDERLMQCDRPLSAIVPGFTVRLAHSLQDGDDRLMPHDRSLSAIVSLSRSDHASPPGWRRTSHMQHDQRPSAIVSGRAEHGSGSGGSGLRTLNPFGFFKLNTRPDPLIFQIGFFGYL